MGNKKTRFLDNTEFKAAIKGNCPVCCCPATMGKYDGVDQYYSCKPCGEKWRLAMVPSYGERLNERAKEE